MRRLLLTGIGLLALCAGSIIAAMIAGGRLQPKWSPYFDHLDLCGVGLLCFWGIKPGSTSMPDAQAILKSQGFAIAGDAAHNLFRVKDVEVQLRADKDNVNVAYIGLRLDLNNTPIRLGDILEKFGSANTVYIAGGASTAINYQNFYARTTSNAWPNRVFISVQDRIGFIGIQESLDGTACQNSVKWRGLRSARRYIQDQVACYESKIPF